MISLNKITITEEKFFKKLYEDYTDDLKNYKVFPKTFNLNFLDLYFSNSDFYGYFIENNHNILGFLLIEKNIIVDDISIDYYISDIYISNRFRNKKFATNSIELFFKLNKGSYLVGQLINNINAIHFWKKLYTKNNIDYIKFTSIMDDNHGIFQYFTIY